MGPINGPREGTDSTNVEKREFYSCLEIFRENNLLCTTVWKIEVFYDHVFLRKNWKFSVKMIQK